MMVESQGTLKPALKQRQNVDVELVVPLGQREQSYDYGYKAGPRAAP
jgi:hypothetical protein